MTVRSRGGVLFGPLLIWFRCFASARFTRARRLDPPARRPSPAYAPCPCACLSSTCSAQKHTLVAFNCEFLIPQRPVFARGRYSFSQASSPLVSSLCVRLLFGMRLLERALTRFFLFVAVLFGVRLGLGWVGLCWHRDRPGHLSTLAPPPSLSSTSSTCTPSNLVHLLGSLGYWCRVLLRIPFQPMPRPRIPNRFATHACPAAQ